MASSVEARACSLVALPIFGKSLFFQFPCEMDCIFDLWKELDERYSQASRSACY